MSDVTFAGTNCTIDTSGLTVGCVAALADGGFPFTFTTVMQSDGSQVAVLAANSLTIQQGAQVTVVGTVPLVVFAQTTVNIQGTLNSASPGNAGGATVTMSGAGGGPGGGPAGGNGAGAGGGGYCGTGGRGVSAVDGGAPAARSYGNATIVPLLGGSAGGNAAGFPDGGEGGGAIQISAGSSILLGTGGVINVPGLGGGNIFGGGGGSGGAILLEAPSVTIDGILATNGGGAGAGTASGSAGQSGQPSSQPATGGGGAGSQINGADGQAGAVGNGGGAVGRIRINTTSGSATLGANAIVSPATSTSCATQGVVGQ